MSKESGIDRLYAVPQDRVGNFVFDEAVARVFSDMIERSVPGYALMLQMLGLLAGEHLAQGGRCYDLGCSQGAASVTIARTPGCESLEIVAVDNAPAMVERLRQRLEQELPDARIHPLCADIRDTPIRDASLVVLNLTLQFIPREQRPGLLTRIREGMVPGGLLFLSEKLRFDDPGEQARMQGLLESFKRARGYSAMEIAQKRTALEQVLLPDTEGQHLARLSQAGFREVRTVLRCLNFASFVAWV